MNTEKNIIVHDPAAGTGLTDQQSEFPDRLASLIGSLSVRAFARKAGVSDTFLRQCLAGRTEPTRTKLLAMAKAGGKSVEWLATGKEPGPTHPVSRHSPDRQLLETIIDITESVLEESGRTLTPAKKAHLVSAVYEMYEGTGQSTIARDAILRLVTCVA